MVDAGADGAGRGGRTGRIGRAVQVVRVIPGPVESARSTGWCRARSSAVPGCRRGVRRRDRLPGVRCGCAVRCGSRTRRTVERSSPNRHHQAVQDRVTSLSPVRTAYRTVERSSPTRHHRAVQDGVPSGLQYGSRTGQSNGRALLRTARPYRTGCRPVPRGPGVPGGSNPGPVRGPGTEILRPAPAGCGHRHAWRPVGDRAPGRSPVRSPRGGRGQAPTAIRSRSRRAVSEGVEPTRTPAASSACFFASAVPDEPETMAPAWPIVLPSGAVKPAM